MSKIKQKYNAFRTAEHKYNQRKHNLSLAFSEQLHVCAKESNKERFLIIANEMIETLGGQYSFTVTQINMLYKLDWW